MKQGSLVHREETRENLQKKNPTKVEKSRNFQTYSQWVKSGWSATLCERKAYELFGEVISHDSFRNYGKRLYPIDVIPTSIMRKKLRRVDVILDEVAELDVLISNQKLRVGRALEREEAMPLPMKIVDDMIRTLKELIETRAKLTGKLRGPMTSVAAQQTTVIPEAVMRGSEMSDDELDENIKSILDNLSVRKDVE